MFIKLTIYYWKHLWFVFFGKLSISYCPILCHSKLKLRNKWSCIFPLQELINVVIQQYLPSRATGCICCIGLFSVGVDVKGEAKKP